MKRALLSISAMLAACTAWQPPKPPPFDPPKSATSPPPPAIHPVKRTAVKIAMRDGVHLNTVIMTPGGFDRPRPIVLERTPYEAPPSDAGLDSPALQESFWVRHGYIVVVQDSRGRYASEGKFVMCQPPRDPSNPKATDETTDAWDTMDWLVKNVPNNNGKIGMFGTSYDGWLVIMALLDPHPAFKMARPEAAPADTFLGDDFFHNGALRRAPSFEYVAAMEGGTASKLIPFKFDKNDNYEWHLGMGALHEMEDKLFKTPRPTWEDFKAHTTYDAYWKVRNVTSLFKKPTVPTLHVSGFFDVEDFYGSFTNYLAMEKLDTDKKNHLLLGPWQHGGWERKSVQKLGKIDFGVDPNVKFNELTHAWLQHYLEDDGPADDTEAWVFETGDNRWRAFDRFPPPSKTKNLYLREGRSLSFDAPVKDGTDEYTSDPENPVPYSARPMTPFWPFDDTGLGPSYGLWRLADQRFAGGRPDVLEYTSAPLDHDMTVAGDLMAHLFASTTGKDCDFIVKLIDAYPEDGTEMGGYQLMVAGEVMPARFRKGYERAVAMPSGKVEEIGIDLRLTDHRFLKGHRIVVTVQSTWFPLIERNPGTLVSAFTAKRSDFVKTTQKVAHSPKSASRIELPVIED